MATVTATISAHAQLTANTVDTVTLGSDYDRVEVVNRTGDAEIFITVGSADAPPTDPAVAGDGATVLPAAIGAVQLDVPGSGKTVVKLKSAGTPKYSVGPV